MKWNGTAIAELKGDIPHPEVNAAKVDFTNRDLTWEESKPGKKSVSDLQVSGNFLPGNAVQAAIIADFLSGTTREVIIEDTTAGFTWTFNAWVSKRGGASPDGDTAQSFTVTLTVTGTPVYAATASGGLSALTGIEQEAGGALDFVPNFGAAVMSYNCLVNTASTWVKFTPTAASHTITITCGTQSQTVVTTQQSTAITIGAADSLTVITMKVQESGKTALYYTFNIARP
jgi:hypothetical protein